MKYNCLFFDLDDTLWDTFHNNQACLKELYVAHHFSSHYPSFEAFSDYYWPYNNELWRQYRAGEIDKQTLITERFRHVLLPLGIDDAALALALNDEFLKRSMQKKGVVPGAIELLEYLRPHYRLFILSNGFREVQSEKMRVSGLLPYFDGLILSEDVNVQKPHPRLFDHALCVANTTRSECLMIGDSWEADIVGAHQSQIDTLWFNPTDAQPQEFLPTYSVRNLSEIIQLL